MLLFLFLLVGLPARAFSFFLGWIRLAARFRRRTSRRRLLLGGLSHFALGRAGPLVALDGRRRRLCHRRLARFRRWTNRRLLFGRLSHFALGRAGPLVALDGRRGRLRHHRLARFRRWTGRRLLSGRLSHFALLGWAGPVVTLDRRHGWLRHGRRHRRLRHGRLRPRRRSRQTRASRRGCDRPHHRAWGRRVGSQDPGLLGCERPALVSL